ncbi:hypothetical protein MMC17_007153 [Xylographa soralifera]|nr:hypothetical protein [Xylographa soralifera]
MTSRLVADATQSVSNAAKSLLRFTWRGTESVRVYEEHAKSFIYKDDTLKKDAVEIVFAGKPYPTLGNPPDPIHATAKIMGPKNKTITSIHVYADGKVVASKKKFNKES